jgi:hypothetical protein
MYGVGNTVWIGTSTLLLAECLQPLTIGQIGYFFLLNAVEFISLANPPLPLKTGRAQFPRLPTLYLALAETAALGMVVWTSIVLLNEHDGPRPVDCPILSCVTAGEALGVYGFMVEVSAGLIHGGFWLGAWSNWVERWIPL